MRYDSCVAEDPDTSARSLARRRWDQPANVTRRVESVAKHIVRTIATTPPGRERDRLTRALDELKPER